MEQIKTDINTIKNTANISYNDIQTETGISKDYLAHLLTKRQVTPRTIQKYETIYRAVKKIARKKTTIARNLIKSIQKELA